MSHAAINDHRRASSTHPSRTIPSPSSPSRSSTAVEIEAGRLGADEEQARSRGDLPERGERLEELWDALARVDVPERTDQRRAVEHHGLDRRQRPRRVGHDDDWAGVPRLTHVLRHMGRVRNHPAGIPQHLPDERELLGTTLPERGQSLVEHAVRNQPSDDAALPLHSVEISVPVRAADRDPRDQVVEDEVVEHDRAWLSSKGVDDPAVRIRVVADVVERKIGAAW